jgi:hypothetical protein
MINITSKLALIFTLALTVFAAKAQVSITGLGQTNAYTQNFNNLSASANTPWINNSTLANWYAESTKETLTTLYASNGSTNNGGFYNFGSTNSTDRALGSIGSGPKGDFNWGVRMKNNTSVTITAFYVSFTGEQWLNSKAAAQSLTVSYRTSTSAITSVSSGTWTAVPSLSFTSPVKGGTAGSLDGNFSANRSQKTYTITGISLAPGSEIMIRWNDINHKASDHALSIDDVTISALTPNQFYSKAAGSLNTLASWGTNTDGSGTAPTSFSGQGQIFNIRNSAAKSIATNWTISGFGSKAILNNAGSAINFTIPAGTTMTGILDIANAATVTINSETTPTIGSVATNSTIIYGNGSQTLEGAVYGNLTIAGGGDKKLTGPASVKGILSFINGSINLADYDFTMVTGSSITGANAANYLKTSGVGSLIRMVAKGSPVTFPVGTTVNYNPVSLSLTNNSTDDNFATSVAPKLFTSYDENNQANGTEINAKVINATWSVSEETEGGSNATVQLQWVNSDELTGFDRSQSSVSQYANNTWTTNTFAAASGTGTYTRTLSGLSTFGVFGVTGKGANLTMTPLPVELLSFNAVSKSNQVELNWVTATEINNEKFVIERSLNGSTWNEIGQVKGSGNSSTLLQYNFTDSQPNTSASQVYYRLKQIDFDGTFAYSKLQVVKMTKISAQEITLVANPVKDKIQLNLNGNNLQQAVLEIITLNGIKVQTSTLSENEAAAGINVSNLAPGMYIYRITGQLGLTSTGRMLKVN